MRKSLYALPLAAAVLATPAFAQDRYHSSYYPAAPVVTGAVVGTVAGVGLYNGWWGTSAAVQPCRGFQALFGMNRDSCVNGQYVGDMPRRVSARERRVVVR